VLNPLATLFSQVRLCPDRISMSLPEHDNRRDRGKHLGSFGNKELQLSPTGTRLTASLRTLQSDDDIHALDRDDVVLHHVHDAAVRRRAGRRGGDGAVPGLVRLLWSENVYIRSGLRVGASIKIPPSSFIGRLGVPNRER
jgi:hypothetical protein